MQLLIGFIKQPVVFVRLGAGVVPPTDEEPHAVIDPSALMAAKAD
jgi:hypothetical protein